MSTPVHIDRREGGAHLGVAEADAQRVQQAPHLGPINLAVAIGVDAFEAVTQRIQRHARRLARLGRRLHRQNAVVISAVLGLASCQKAAENPQQGPPRATAEHTEAHPVVSAEGRASLPPLRSDWLVEVAQEKHTTVIMPPIGATAPARLVVGVHGAGDRPDWACGGWRLGSQVTALVACPQGHPLGPTTYAWVSPQQLEERTLVTVEVVRARYAAYLAQPPYIFAGFSQGATLAEPFLRKHAALFPIAILAEGGYRTLSSPAFAAAYRAGGGRRVVLVCGNPACFATARSAKGVLERAGLEALVVGDEKAGHNLNGRMQRALQTAWPQIVAPIP